jgi:hypothetical protein
VHAQGGKPRLVGRPRPNDSEGPLTAGRGGHRVRPRTKLCSEQARALAPPASFAPCEAAPRSTLQPRRTTRQTLRNQKLPRCCCLKVRTGGWWVLVVAVVPRAHTRAALANRAAHLCTPLRFRAVRVLGEAEALQIKSEECAHSKWMCPLPCAGLGSHSAPGGNLPHMTSREHPATLLASSWSIDVNSKCRPSADCGVAPWWKSVRLNAHSFVNSAPNHADCVRFLEVMQKTATTKYRVR